MARLWIEEMVLGEMVFLTPEADPDEPEIDESGAWIGPTPGMGEWVPLGPDPGGLGRDRRGEPPGERRELRRETSQAD